MDIIDKQIVELLKENSRKSASDISREVGLSISAVSERIRKLEEQSVIQQYTIKVGRKAIGAHILVFIMVEIEGVEETGEFRRAMTEIPNVLECHHIAGEFDYLLKVAVDDMEALETILMERIKNHHGVLNTKTLMVFSSMKEEINI